MKTKIFAMLLSLVAFAGCGKDDDEVSGNEINQSLQGTWSAQASLAVEGMELQVNETLVLTATTFTRTWLIVAGSTTQKFGQFEGSVTENNNALQFTCTEVGTPDESGQAWVTISKNTAGFDQALQQLGIASPYQATYTLNGSQLVIKADMNGDGDFTDGAETVTYSKQ